jgi:2-amino-4-hydroxy-6-hydroxymethyldihydropteridine diphosphokinase
MHKIYLALGSNTGDRKQHLLDALEALTDIMTIHALAPVYETDPVGVTDQPAFLNTVLSGETSLTPLALLDAVKSIEVGLGRQSGIRWGPRLIDIDILLYDDETVCHARLRIPHPEMKKRGFVLIPLSQIAPDLTFPDGSSLAAYLEEPSMWTGVRLWGTLSLTETR